MGPKNTRMLTLLVLILSVLNESMSVCPLKCTCYHDTKHRLALLCKDGGIEGDLNLLINFDNVTAETQVIKITAPDDRTNMLTMSPVFRSYENLEEIHITKSNVPQLGMHFFYGLKKLRVLDLAQNNISQPLDHNFLGLENLQELYLDDNRIQSLPSGTFRYLPELRTLSVQRNRITQLANKLFLEVGKLLVLKLNGNRLEQLHPEVFKDVQDLRILECRGCGLTTLNKEIYTLLPQLRRLDLGDNEIKKISLTDLKDLKNLNELLLDGNQITAIQDNIFVKQPNLLKLNLARNEIFALEKRAFNGIALTELDLSYNKLESLVREVFEPINGTLEVLLLNGNHVKEHYLWTLNQLSSLKQLGLAECGLADISIKRVFPEFLETLDLSGNHLSSLYTEVLPSNLRHLDISRNRFRGLDESVLQKLDYVKYVKLEDNPWACDLCHIVALLDRTNRSSSFHDIVCYSPYSVKGKQLGTLHMHDLTWCNSGSYAGDANFYLLGEDSKVGIIAASMSVFLLVLTVFAILGALCYNRRHAAKYYTHEDKLAIEGEAIIENQSPLFCDGELSFKFPLDSEKKMSISTIEEVKKEHVITNGTA